MKKLKNLKNVDVGRFATPCTRCSLVKFQILKKRIHEEKKRKKRKINFDVERLAKPFFRCSLVKLQILKTHTWRNKKIWQILTTEALWNHVLIMLYLFIFDTIKYYQILSKTDQYRRQQSQPCSTRWPPSGHIHDLSSHSRQSPS